MESVLFIRKLLSGDLHPSPTQSGRLLCSPGPGTERGACRPADSPLSSKTKFVSHTLFTAAIPEGICSQNINWLNYETVYQPFTLRAAPMRATQSELGSGPRAGRRNGQGGEPGCVQRRPSHTEASVLLHRVFSWFLNIFFLGLFVFTSFIFPSVDPLAPSIQMDFKCPILLCTLHIPKNVLWQTLSLVEELRD